jgi:predicted ATPase/DNA-binding winged helix-turn-helix (wHTH) protein
VQTAFASPAALLPPVPSAILRFERFELRPHERQLLVDGNPAALGARAYDLLLALAERAGQLVSKNELLDLVWPNVVVEENNLQVQVGTLRKILGAQLIATIPGRGYRLTAQVRDKVQPLPPTRAPDSTDELSRRAKLRTNLPDVLLPLIGRDDDLAALDALIERHRLVSIVGAGGVGKTRLAQALLAERRSSYEHGVCFVELAPTRQPEAVPGAIGAALGVNIGGSGDAVKALVGAVAPLSVLIALDNAEHLVEAVAAISEALLAESPQVHLVVTSQVPLKLPAERLYRLGALAVPEDTPSAEQALSYGAVALFAERAQAADRHFALTEANVPSVIELCRRLDGMALAIELAAARVPLLGLSKLVASLDQRLRVLTAGSRTAPDRQQTLRGTLEWSHGLLDQAQRIVFRRLAVFTGSAPLEAAQRVLADEAPGSVDEWTVLDALGTLVDRSLVEVIADQRDDCAAPRYRLLDTPLAYARETLHAAGEEEAVRRRHAQAVRAIFERAFEQLWSGEVGVDTWQEQLRPDLDNGLAAVTWALMHDPATALAIAAPLSRAMSGNLHGKRVALWEAVEPLLDEPASSAPPALVARAALGCASNWGNARPRRSLTRAQQALTLFRSISDRPGCYRALAQAALASARLDDLAAARAAVEQMCSLEDPNWPPVLRGCGAEAQGNLYHFRGDEDKAFAWLLKQLDLEQSAGIHDSVALNNLAYIALAVGHVEEAERSGRALIEQFGGTRHQWKLAIARINLTAALLAHDGSAQARFVAAEGWPQARIFDIRAEWADYLALLAALEHRPRTALRLAGYADASYAARDVDRQSNELNAVQRAERLARAELAPTLDPCACDRLKAEGAALREDDIAALAFADLDASP